MWCVLNFFEIEDDFDRGKYEYVVVIFLFFIIIVLLCSGVLGMKILINNLLEIFVFNGIFVVIYFCKVWVCLIEIKVFILCGFI